MQQRRADEVRSVARAELTHHLCPVALEGARADLHAKRALLVGIAVADQVEDLALPPGQRLLVGIRQCRDGRRAAAPIAALAPSLPSTSRRRERYSRGAADLPDQCADALRLQPRILDHLVQMIALPASRENRWLCCFSSSM